MKHLGRKAFAIFAPLALFAALLVGPSMASAHVVNPAHWTKNGKRLTGSASLGLSGRLTLGGALGSVSCNTSGTDVIHNAEEEGTSAQDEVTVFNISSSGCATTGALAGCTVTEAKAEGLPWRTYGYFDAEGNPRVEIDGVRFTDVFAGAECPLPGVTASGSLDAYLVLNASGEITGVEFRTTSGTLTTEPEIGPVTITGTEAVSPSGTYDLDPGL